MMFLFCLQECLFSYHNLQSFYVFFVFFQECLFSYYHNLLSLLCFLLFFCFVLRNACYHIDSTLATPAQAELSCGNLGGRTASFASKAEIDLIKTKIPLTEMWIGDFLLLFVYNFVSRLLQIHNSFLPFYQPTAIYHQSPPSHLKDHTNM